MVVEPEGLCWIPGRMAEVRDGVTWAREFARLPALRAVVRDGGTGLGKGVRLDNLRRRAAGLAEFDETLDVFHTLREGGRALRQAWGVASRALDRAAAAQQARAEAPRATSQASERPTAHVRFTEADALLRTFRDDLRIELRRAEAAGRLEDLAVETLRTVLDSALSAVRQTLR